jgi:stage IV sporulation protein FB
MFGIGPTPFDLRLVAFRIPVRVHPTFWLGSLLFGSNLENGQLIFIWVMCSFVSILIHELGHALTAEMFDWPSEIILYFGGGLAISHRYRNDTPGRNIAVSIMGPMAGFMFLALLIAVELLLNANRIWVYEYRFFTFQVLKFMNLYWGLLNLLPVLPLDGGQILQSVCRAIRLRDPVGVAMKIGVVVGGAAAYYYFAVARQQFVGMLMLMLCMQNVSALQSRR